MKTNRHGILFVTWVIVVLVFISCAQENNIITEIPIKLFPNRTEDFSLWQLESFNQELQMAYVIKTDDDKIIIIDGGDETSTAKLENFIIQLGGIVDSWVITHSHDDHAGAFLNIIERKNIHISNIYHSELSALWVKENEAEFYENFLTYHHSVKSSGITSHDMNIGEVLQLGQGVKMTIIGARNEEITGNAINNSSLIFKIESEYKSIIFLGDLGIEGGNKLVTNTNAALIKADYVQIAHHGSNGVDKNVYEAIQPDFAFWPTPDWLWYNYDYDNAQIGTWETPSVRAWMRNLNVEIDYVSGLDGTQQID